MARYGLRGTEEEDNVLIQVVFIVTDMIGFTASFGISPL
jgi:hypothetical protein